MSTGHIVTHVGTRGAEKRCWRAGCNRPATETLNARSYCPAHMAVRPVEPDFAHVQTARRMMSNTGGGLTLSDIAGRLGVGTGALDRALWRYMGRS